MYQCPLCCSEEAALLGRLGNLYWVRCIDCGAVVHIPESELDDEQDAPEEDLNETVEMIEEA